MYYIYEYVLTKSHNTLYFYANTIATHVLCTGIWSYRVSRFETSLEISATGGKVEGIARCISEALEAVVTDDSLVHLGWLSHLVAESDPQRRPVVVVVGEERHFEATCVEETTPLALWTLRIVDDGDAVVQHPRPVFSSRMRNQVTVLEVDAEH